MIHIVVTILVGSPIAETLVTRVIDQQPVNHRLVVIWKMFSDICEVTIKVWATPAEQAIYADVNIIFNYKKCNAAH